MWAQATFRAGRLLRLTKRAQSQQRLGLVSEQVLYNLLERRAELEVLPACREYGLGLIPGAR